MSHLFVKQTKGDMGDSARNFVVRGEGGVKRKREEADKEAYGKAVKSAFKFKGSDKTLAEKKKKKKKKNKEKPEGLNEMNRSELVNGESMHSRTGIIAGAASEDWLHAPQEIDVAAAKKKQQEEEHLLTQGQSLLREDRKPAKNLSMAYMHRGHKEGGTASAKLNDRIKKKSDRYAR